MAPAGHLLKASSGDHTARWGRRNLIRYPGVGGEGGFAKVELTTQGQTQGQALRTERSPASSGSGRETPLTGIQKSRGLCLFMTHGPQMASLGSRALNCCLEAGCEEHLRSRASHALF